MNLQEQFEKRVQRLKCQYIESLAERYERLVPIMAKLLHGTAVQEEIIQARLDIHKIAGTAASFALADLGQAAQAANQYIDGGDVNGPEAQKAFIAIMELLEEVVVTDLTCERA